MRKWARIQVSRPWELSNGNGQAQYKPSISRRRSRKQQKPRFWDASWGHTCAIAARNNNNNNKRSIQARALTGPANCTWMCMCTVVCASMCVCGILKSANNRRWNKVLSIQLQFTSRHKRNGFYSQNVVGRERPRQKEIGSRSKAGNQYNDNGTSSVVRSH